MRWKSLEEKALRTIVFCYDSASWQRGFGDPTPSFNDKKMRTGEAGVNNVIVLVLLAPVDNGIKPRMCTVHCKSVRALMQWCKTIHHFPCTVAPFSIVVMASME
ncbi:unnamed protein product [Leptosia nina]|uniref:Uncharacterized protein n=1 Tax=Leptosia nina TaxID=320188 RepID=A0AAV1K528_9NEOP